MAATEGDKVREQAYINPAYSISCPLYVHRITTTSLAWRVTSRSFSDELRDPSNFFCLPVRVGRFPLIG